MIIQAPFPYFGGKSKAAPLVWSRFGDVKNYVEPFAGSAAMLLAAPDGKRVETINDLDGFVANFWRAVSRDPDAVAGHADYPVIEADLEARHAWLVQRSARLRWSLEDPDFFDAKIAGWWVWGACAWIGSGWCAGAGPHMTNGAHMFDRRKLPHVGDAGRGINRKLPHVGNAGRGINRKLPHVGNAGRGINRKLPHVGDAGRGINRKLPHVGDAGRGEFIADWMRRLAERMRDVRVLSGKWERAVTDAVTTRHGITAVFMDPPYAKGSMDYAAGGVGTSISGDVAAWCVEHGSDPGLRIVLCGHGGEHDMSAHGWTSEKWKAGGGYATSDVAVKNRESETIWCSPYCVQATERAA